MVKSEKSLFSQEFNEHPGSHARVAFNMDLAVAGNDDVLCDSRPEARPAQLTSAGLVDSAGPLEDPVEMFGGYRDTAVGDEIGSYGAHPFEVVELLLRLVGYGIERLLDVWYLLGNQGVSEQGDCP